MDQIQVRDSRPKGFFWADNEVVDYLAALIGPTALALYIVLCRLSDNRTSRSTVSISSLEKYLSISRHTVLKSINILVEYQLIALEHRTSPKGNEINAYTLMDVKTLVQNLHYPSAENALPLVQNLHQPSAPNALRIKTLNQDSDKDSRARDQNKIQKAETNGNNINRQGKATGSPLGTARASIPKIKPFKPGSVPDLPGARLPETRGRSE